MLLSMTGFGSAKGNHRGREYTVELRSLNGRNSDIRVKIPSSLKDKEIVLRKMVMDEVIRGKIDLSVNFTNGNGEEEGQLDISMFRKYSKDLLALCKELKIEQADIINAVLKLPNVVHPVVEEISDEEWKGFLTTIQDAITHLQDFRKVEGDVMAEELVARIGSIQDNLKAIAPYESQRIDSLKERLGRQLQDWKQSDDFDPNRFEQELIYYLEKLDINEEKVRLEQHCLYFMETLNSEDPSTGRKLNFISQEMGREINTLGAKAQSSEIQRYVVLMKDDLEKIKEMVANAL